MANQEVLGKTESNVPRKLLSEILLKQLNTLKGQTVLVIGPSDSHSTM